MGYDATYAGYTTAMTGISAIIAAPFVARFSTKVDPRYLIAGGVAWLGVMSGRPLQHLVERCGLVDACMATTRTGVRHALLHAAGDDAGAEFGPAIGNRLCSRIAEFPADDIRRRIDVAGADDLGGWPACLTQRDRREAAAGSGERPAQQLRLLDGPDKAGDIAGGRKRGDRASSDPCLRDHRRPAVRHSGFS